MSEWDVLAASLLRWSHRVYTLRGLRKAGFRVLVLESNPRRTPCEPHRVTPAGLALVQFRRVAPPRWRDPILFAAYRRLDTFAAKHCGAGRSFWGWSGQSLSALEACRERGISGILDCGSTHVDWFARRLGREYASQGAAPSGLARLRLNARIVAEYDAADFICVPSPFVARTFIDHGVDDGKLHLNPYGVDTSFWSRAAASRNTSSRPFRADTDALAGRLDHAMRHRERLPDMGASARGRVAPYTWNSYGERAAAFLQDRVGIEPGRYSLKRPH